MNAGWKCQSNPLNNSSQKKTLNQVYWKTHSLIYCIKKSIRLMALIGKPNFPISHENRGKKQKIWTLQEENNEVKSVDAKKSLPMLIKTQK